MAHATQLSVRQAASAGPVYSPKNFGFEIVCSKCKGPLRLIALIKTEDVAKKLLKAMHLPTEIPELHPARPPPRSPGVAGGEDRASDDRVSRRKGHGSFGPTLGLSRRTGSCRGNAGPNEGSVRTLS